MRLTVAAVGRLKTGPERELAERYRDRAIKTGRAIGFRGLDVVEVDESRSRDPKRRMIEESVAIAALIRDRAAVVALDERGEILTSKAFSDILRRFRDDGRPDGVFVIGGPDGLAANMREKADLVLGFGAQSWPHQLVRIMLLEQIYRATTILSGHPYHRE